MVERVLQSTVLLFVRNEQCLCWILSNQPNPKFCQGTYCFSHSDKININHSPTDCLPVTSNSNNQRINFTLDFSIHNAVSKIFQSFDKTMVSQTKSSFSAIKSDCLY